MALPKDDPMLQSLLEQAKKELLAQNPRFFDPPEPYTDEEYEAMLKEWEEFDRNISEPLSKQLGDIQISDIINEDRGE